MSNPEWTTTDGAQASSSTEPTTHPFEADSEAVKSTLDAAKEVANNFEHTVGDAVASAAQTDGSHPFELKPGDSTPASTNTPNPFEHVANEVQEQAKNAEAQIKKAAEEASQHVEQKVNEASSTIQSIQTAATNASSQIEEACSKVEQKIEDTVSTIKDSDIAKSLESAAQEAAKEVKEACTSVEHSIEEAESKIKASLGVDENQQNEEPKEAQTSEKNSNLIRNIGICAVGAVAVFLIARFIGRRRK